MLRLQTVAEIAARIKKDRQVLGMTAYVLDLLMLGSFLVVLNFGLSSFVASRDQAREDEVKANLRVIQVALERYAVDRGGDYPMMLYGGHSADTFATSRSAEVSEFQGDVDVLLEFGYLQQYPQNPFRRDLHAQLSVNSRAYFAAGVDFPRDPNGVPIPRLNRWATGGTRGHFDRSQQWVVRQVGGPLGDRMWDISEGQRHPPLTNHVVPHDGVGPVNCPDLNCTRPYLTTSYPCWLAVGNFYYFPLSYSSLTNFTTFDATLSPLQDAGSGWDAGYILAGIGGPGESGQDLWSVAGEMWELPQSPEVTGRDRYIFDIAGPDGRSDGVLDVLKGIPDKSYLFVIID